MGFRFTELKKQRDQHLRAIRKRELLSPGCYLFQNDPGIYSLELTCDLNKEQSRKIVPGTFVLLTIDAGRFVVWGNAAVLGYLSAEDAADIGTSLADNGGTCLAQIISTPNEFDSFSVKVVPSGEKNNTEGGKL